MRELFKTEQAIVVMALDRLEAVQSFKVPTVRQLADELRDETVTVWVLNRRQAEAMKAIAAVIAKISR